MHLRMQTLIKIRQLDVFAEASGIEARLRIDPGATYITFHDSYPDRFELSIAVEKQSNATVSLSNQETVYDRKITILRVNLEGVIGTFEDDCFTPYDLSEHVIELSELQQEVTCAICMKDIDPTDMTDRTKLLMPNLIDILDTNCLGAWENGTKNPKNRHLFTAKDSIFLYTQLPKHSQPEWLRKLTLTLNTDKVSDISAMQTETILGQAPPPRVKTIGLTVPTVKDIPYLFFYSFFYTLSMTLLVLFAATPAALFPGSALADLIVTAASIIVSNLPFLAGLHPLLLLFTFYYIISGLGILKISDAETFRELMRVPYLLITYPLQKSYEYTLKYFPLILYSMRHKMKFNPFDFTLGVLLILLLSSDGELVAVISVIACGLIASFIVNTIFLPILIGPILVLTLFDYIHSIRDVFKFYRSSLGLLFGSPIFELETDSYFGQMIYWLTTTAAIGFFVLSIGALFPASIFASGSAYLLAQFPTIALLNTIELFVVTSLLMLASVNYQLTPGKRAFWIPLFDNRVNYGAEFSTILQYRTDLSKEAGHRNLYFNIGRWVLTGVASLEYATFLLLKMRPSRLNYPIRLVVASALYPLSIYGQFFTSIIDNVFDLLSWNSSKSDYALLNPENPCSANLSPFFMDYDKVLPGYSGPEGMLGDLTMHDHIMAFHHS